MRSLILIPIFALTLVLQTAIVNQLTILSGFANMLLLVVISWSINTEDNSLYFWAFFSAILFIFVSASSPIVPITSFLLSAFIARRVAKSLWQVPVMALVFTTILATLVDHSISILSVWIGSSFSASPIQMFQYITLPSLFLNLIFIIPVNSVIRDLASWTFPKHEFE